MLLRLTEAGWLASHQPIEAEVKAQAKVLQGIPDAVERKKRVAALRLVVARTRGTKPRQTCVSMV